MMRRACTVFSRLIVLVLLFATLAPRAARASANDTGGTGGEVRDVVTRADAPAMPALAADSVELYRLRVINRRDGAIQVSTDAGATWRLIGRVLSPATTAAEGYTAAQYAAPGTVAAIAVHGIRIRVGADDATLHDPLVLSIDPVEYGGDSAQEPGKGYGGQVTGSAGILTDIHAGTSLFREVAPLVGNAVGIERPGDGALTPMPSGFRPTGKGEVLVIAVTAPKVSLTSVVFENHGGGSVTATFADGTTREITHVTQPVMGVGRFDGTSYTGVGRVNTDHTGVITVSTAPVDRSHPEGEGRETRGGFQISPAWHNARTEEAGAATAMTIGGDPAAPRKRELEGTAPLFLGNISLSGALEDGSPASVCDISIDGGDWEPMPTLVGSLPDAFTAAGLTRVLKAQGITRPAAITQGVTAFRLRFAPLTVESARLAADAAVEACRARRYAAASRGGLPIVHDVLTVNARPSDARRVAYVRLLVEDMPRGVTNVAPFSLTWNTTSVPDGEYLIETDALDDNGALLAVTRRKVYVLNHAPPTSRTVPPVSPTKTVSAGG